MALGCVITLLEGSDLVRFTVLLHLSLPVTEREDQRELSFIGKRLGVVRLFSSFFISRRITRNEHKRDSIMKEG